MYAHLYEAVAGLRTRASAQTRYAGSQFPAQPSFTLMADRCPSCLVTRSINDAIVMIQLLLSGYSYSGIRTPSTCVSPRRSLACDDVMPPRSQRGSGCALQPCMICNRIVSHLIVLVLPSFSNRRCAKSMSPYVLLIPRIARVVKS
jgi:hypothetical protein